MKNVTRGTQLTAKRVIYFSMGLGMMLSSTLGAGIGHDQLGWLPSRLFVAYILLYWFQHERMPAWYSANVIPLAWGLIIGFTLNVVVRLFLAIPL